MKRIFIVISVLLVILGVVSYFTLGNVWLLPFIVLLGGTVGVPMALFSPTPLHIKIFMVVGLVLSLLAIIYGFKNSKVISGQICAITGIIVWLFIGLMALGVST